MNVNVRLFAVLREQAGTDRVALDVPDGCTAGRALSIAAERTGIADTVHRMSVALAVNRRYAQADEPLRDGDELALIPPVSGG